MARKLTVPSPSVSCAPRWTRLCETQDNPCPSTYNRRRPRHRDNPRVGIARTLSEFSFVVGSQERRNILEKNLIVCARCRSPLGCRPACDPDRLQPANQWRRDGDGGWPEDSEIRRRQLLRELSRIGAGAGRG